MSRYGNDYQDKWVLCPFYRKEDGTRILCEGPENGTDLKIAFPDGESKDLYKKRKCRCNYKTCRIARMLFQRYDEEDE